MEVLPFTAVGGAIQISAVIVLVIYWCISEI